jgi:hypothetical protein
VRAALLLREGPPVASSFLDLGVVQTPVNRASALRQKRIDAGLGKLWRTSVLSLNLQKRCHLVAASGIPASMFGVASSPLSNATLHTLASAALAAIWKYTSRCASELVFTLFVPWRADPTAVSIVNPLLALRAALLHGVHPTADLQWIWDFPHAVGPVRAVMDALRRSGTSFNASTLTLVNPWGSVPLLSTSAHAVRHLLLYGQTLARLAKLAKRRPVFAYLEHGIDLRATSAFERTLAPESRKAALRVVQVGGTITQSVASRWIPGGPTCPFCTLAGETPLHRFWQCPRWYKIRSATLGTHTRRGLEEVLGTQAVLTGVIPSEPALRAVQAVAEQAGRWPAVIRLPEQVWTDGSCTHPRDSLIRRAAWAVVGTAGTGFVTLGASMVIGRQTIGRAELSALVWVSMCGGSNAIIYAQYLVGCFLRCANGLVPAALLDWENGDLWRCLLRPLPVKWVKAHLTAAQAVLAGVSEEDRWGNDAADVACSSLANLNKPHVGMLQARERQLAAALVVQSVLAHIQEAALEEHHRPGTNIAKRKWNRRRPKLRVRKAARSAKPLPPGLIAPVGPTVIHAVVIDPWPLPDTALGRHVVSWRISCANCDRTAKGTGRWAVFCKELCFSRPRAVDRRREPAVHDLQAVVGGWACVRCRLPVASRRRSSAATARCPIPLVIGPTASSAPWPVCKCKSTRPPRLIGTCGVGPPYRGPLWECLARRLPSSGGRIGACV